LANGQIFFEGDGSYAIKLSSEILAADYKKNNPTLSKLLDYVTTISLSGMVEGTLLKPRFIGEANIKLAGDEASEISAKEILFDEEQLSAKIGLNVKGDSQLLKSSPAFVSLTGNLSTFLVGNMHKVEGDVEAVFEPFDGGGKPPPDQITRLPATSAIAGKARAKVDYRFEFDKWLEGEGSINIPTLDLIYADISIKNIKPLNFAIREQGVKWVAQNILIDEQPITVRGEVGLLVDAAFSRLNEPLVTKKGSWNVGISGDWELNKIVPKHEMIDVLDGSLSFALQVKGELGTPKISGDLVIKDGTILIPQAKGMLDLTALAASSQLNNNILTIHSIKGDIGDGKLFGSGKIQDVWSPAALTNISLSIQELSLQPIKRFNLTTDANLLIDKNGEKPFNISGDVFIKNGEYEDKIDLKKVLSALSSFIHGVKAKHLKRSVLNEQPMAAFNVNIKTTDEILVDTDVAQLQLVVNGKLKGDSIVPHPVGVIELVGGTFGLRVDQFEIISGTISLDEGSASSIDPNLDIVGEALLDGDNNSTRIRVAIKGKVTEPLLSFTSDSGLTQQEIVHMLWSGDKGGRVALVKRTSEKRDYRLKDLINPWSDVGLSEKLFGFFRSTDSEIATSVSASTGEIVPILILERPLSERLDLKLESGYAGIWRSIYQLRYALTNDLQLEGGWKDTKSSDTNSSSSSGGFEFGVSFEKPFAGRGVL